MPFYQPNKYFQLNYEHKKFFKSFLTLINKNQTKDNLKTVMWFSLKIVLSIKQLLTKNLIDLKGSFV